MRIWWQHITVYHMFFALGQYGSHGVISSPVTQVMITVLAHAQEYHAFRDRTALLLFAGSSVLLVLLHRAQARVQANAPYTLTPPIMVRPCAQTCTQA